MAALDALLFSCRRVVEQRDKFKKELYNMESATSGDNPWGDTAITSAPDPVMDSTSSPIAIANQLGKSLLPILWAASQKSQPRQSRVAASRWSSDLLMDLDLIQATHILSFLAGDSDVTASAIAREGLSLHDEGSDKPKNSSTNVIGDFEELVHILIPEDDHTNKSALQPTFWDFSSNGKAVAVKCLLRSYLDDFNGGDGDALCVFMGVLTKCLAWKDTTGGNDDVLDACSEALSVCMGSPVARNMIQSSSLPLGWEGLRDLILSTTSAKAKRFLADTFGTFLMDTPLLGTRWMEVVAESLSLSSSCLVVDHLKPSSDTQGAALLGGTCIRLVRLYQNLTRPEICKMASSLLTRFGSALTNADDMIGNVFCDAIYISCSGGFVSEVHDR